MPSSFAVHQLLHLLHLSPFYFSRSPLIFSHFPTQRSNMTGGPPCVWNVSVCSGFVAKAPSWSVTCTSCPAHIRLPASLVMAVIALDPPSRCAHKATKLRYVRRSEAGCTRVCASSLVLCWGLEREVKVTFYRASFTRYGRPNDT